jgi:hypothetical protein
MKLVVAAAALAAVLLSGPHQAAAATSHYYVYCANGRIEVSHSDPNQMRIARGSGVCMLGQFNYLSDAQSFAQRNFGGAGRSCSCR